MKANRGFHAPAGLRRSERPQNRPPTKPNNTAQALTPRRQERGRPLTSECLHVDKDDFSRLVRERCDNLLSDPIRLMEFALQERELADIAAKQFRDPIAATNLRESADKAQVIAGMLGNGDSWTDYPGYDL